jgi:hypothetical protein
MRGYFEDCLRRKELAQATLDDWNERQAVLHQLPCTIERDILLAFRKWGPELLMCKIFYAKHGRRVNGSRIKTGGGDDSRYNAFKKSTLTQLQSFPNEFLAEYTSRAMTQKPIEFDFLWKSVFCISFPEPAQGSILKKADFVRNYYQGKVPPLAREGREEINELDEWITGMCALQDRPNFLLAGRLRGL